MLIGHNEVLVDEKHRIFLPTYTKREKNEEILLTYDQDIDKYLLFSKKASFAVCTSASYLISPVVALIWLNV